MKSPQRNCGLQRSLSKQYAVQIQIAGLTLTCLTGHHGEARWGTDSGARYRRQENENRLVLFLTIQSPALLGSKEAMTPRKQIKPIGHQFYQRTHGGDPFWQAATTRNPLDSLTNPLPVTSKISMLLRPSHPPVILDCPNTASYHPTATVHTPAEFRHTPITVEVSEWDTQWPILQLTQDP